MSSDFFWETDAQDRFTEIVQGPTYVDTVAGAGEALGRAARMFQARAPFRDFEFGRPWPDGSIRYFSVSGEPRLAQTAPSSATAGVGRDITRSRWRASASPRRYSDPLTGFSGETHQPLSGASNSVSAPPARRQMAACSWPRRLQADQRRARPRYRRRAADRRRARLRTVLRASDFVRGSGATSSSW